MNDMNDMNETRLRGWRPRRPSNTLKRRIFSATRESVAPAWRWSWNCAAPAMVCACMALMVVHYNFTAEPHGAKPVVSLLASNESGAVPFSDVASEAENHVAAVTFDWTNHTGFKSSIGSHFGPWPSTNFSN